MGSIVFLLNKLNNGGAQRATAILASKLAESGLDVRLILLQQEPITFEVSELVKVDVLGRSLTPTQALEFFQLENDKSKIDLVITPMHFDLSYLRIMRVLANNGFNTVVIEHASYFYPLTLKLKNVTSHFKERLDIYKEIASLWCVNRKDAFIWETLGARNVCYLPNIYEPEVIEEANIEKSLPKQVLYVGRLQADKNLDWLIKTISFTLKQNDDWVLVLAGRGNREEQLKKLVNSLGLNEKVVFLGYCDNIADVYKNAEFLIVPSNTETFSYALAESKAYALPALVREMPLNELVTTTKGHLLFNDDESFLSGLSKLIKDDALRKHLAKESLVSIQTAFNWESLSLRYIETIEGIVSRRDIDNGNNESLAMVLAQEIVKEAHREIVSVSPRLAFKSERPKLSKRIKLKIKAKFKKIINKIFDCLPKSGVFCVDWHTMPELKETILPKLNARTYYFQTGKNAKKGLLGSFFQRASK